MTDLTTQQIEEKYSIPVTETGCWIWLGNVKHAPKAPLHSYGRYGQSLAHRLVWSVFNGPIPDGVCVCHSCDVPMCVNPNHLFLGTHEENMADMDLKGRRKKGAFVRGADGLPCGAKLTWAKVLEIKEHLKSGMTQTKIAALFGVTQTTISLIKRGRTWID